MRKLYKYMLCLFLLSAPAFICAQIPQELIDKAKASGMTDAQIQKELSKYSEQKGITQTSKEPQETIIPGRTELSRQVLPPIEEQREEKTTEEPLEKIVFGREIFSNKNLTFEPDINLPTPKNYVLSAGDELLINVWGDSELNLKLVVSPDGTILIPNVGPVSLSGLTIEAAENRIRQELGKIMSTLDGNDPNTFVSVGLGQIRSIKVNIVGEAVTPGTYTLSSLASLFNALYAAGGVNDIGSLRNIKVYRDSKEIANLDVYDYLLNGKYDTNIRLEDNDMIIIGPYEELVTVDGKVKRNRTFELRKGETLQQLLDMAGGFTGDAYTEDIRIKRKSGDRYQIATVTEEQFPTFILQDGDSLMVDSVIPFYDNRLIISGAVWRPGEYELSPSVHTVKQLVKQASGLKGDEFTGRAQITRLNPDFTTTVIAVNLVDILNGKAPDIKLQKEDRLHIPSLFDLHKPYTIRVSGAINVSDTVMPFHKNMTVEDAVIQAGGLSEAAATVNVEVARRLRNPVAETSSNQMAKIYNLTLSNGLQVRTNDTLFTLEPFDEVFVRFSPGYQVQQVVQVNGEITFAGDYALKKKNTRLSEIITQSGGVTPDAYVKGASLKRKLTQDEIRQIETLIQLSANKQSRDSININLENIKDYSVGIDLPKALAHPGSTDDLVLRDGDILYIPQQQSTVKISGSVVYPNSITYTKNMTVADCLSGAGGYNDIARKYPIVIYMNGKVATTRRTGIFFKQYPKVEPGCEIIVPAKTRRDRGASFAEILSASSSVTSMAAMITSMINTFK
ncbi:capsule biosynthesis protein [Parabacteroides sp. AM08-6]|nr:SLBB domain-containing protein [Parabacteroides sp. AM08-6]RHJ85296.1 capsule biosynthesis protein [Parabacteroides sp. AM08-6]